MFCPCLAVVWHLQGWRLLRSFFSWLLPSRLLWYRPWRSTHQPASWLHLAQRFWLLPAIFARLKLLLLKLGSCGTADAALLRNKLKRKMSLRRAAIWAPLRTNWSERPSFFFFFFLLTLYTTKKFFLRARWFSSLYFVLVFLFYPFRVRFCPSRFLFLKIKSELKRP